MDWFFFLLDDESFCVISIHNNTFDLFFSVVDSIPPDTYKQLFNSQKQWAQSNKNVLKPKFSGNLTGNVLSSFIFDVIIFIEFVWDIGDNIYFVFKYFFISVLSLNSFSGWIILLFIDWIYFIVSKLLLLLSGIIFEFIIVCVSMVLYIGCCVWFIIFVFDIWDVSFILLILLLLSSFDIFIFLC